jgi:hypothetical protein
VFLLPPFEVMSAALPPLPFVPAAELPPELLCPARPAALPVSSVELLQPSAKSSAMGAQKLIA